MWQIVTSLGIYAADDPSHDRSWRVSRARIDHLS
jgi:hypothetical protein